MAVMTFADPSGRQVSFDWSDPNPPTDADVDGIFKDAESSGYFKTAEPPKSQGFLSRAASAIASKAKDFFGNIPGPTPTAEGVYAAPTTVPSATPTPSIPPVPGAAAMERPAGEKPAETVPPPPTPTIEPKPAPQDVTEGIVAESLRKSQQKAAAQVIPEEGTEISSAPEPDKAHQDTTAPAPPDKKQIERDEAYRNIIYQAQAYKLPGMEQATPFTSGFLKGLVQSATVRAVNPTSTPEEQTGQMVGGAVGGVVPLALAPIAPELIMPAFMASTMAQSGGLSERPLEAIAQTALAGVMGNLPAAVGKDIVTRIGSGALIGGLYSQVSSIVDAMTGEGKIDPASKDNVKQTLLGMAMGIGFGVFHPANPEKGFDKHLRDVGIPEDEVAAIKSFVESQGKGWPKPPPTEPPANPTITPEAAQEAGKFNGPPSEATPQPTPINPTPTPPEAGPTSQQGSSPSPEPVTPASGTKPTETPTGKFVPKPTAKPEGPTTRGARGDIQYSMLGQDAYLGMTQAGHNNLKKGVLLINPEDLATMKLPDPTAHDYNEKEAQAKSRLLYGSAYAVDARAPTLQSMADRATELLGENGPHIGSSEQPNYANSRLHYVDATPDADHGITKDDVQTALESRPRNTRQRIKMYDEYQRQVDPTDIQLSKQYNAQYGTAKEQKEFYASMTPEELAAEAERWKPGPVSEEEPLWFKPRAHNGPNLFGEPEKVPSKLAGVRFEQTDMFPGMERKAGGRGEAAEDRGLEGTPLEAGADRERQGREQTTLFQVRPKTAGDALYSHLDNTLASEDAPKRGDAATWRGWLKARDVKDDEMVWSGLQDALDNGGTLTREQVREATTPVEVRETRLGEDEPSLEVLRKKVKEADAARQNYFWEAKLKYDDGNPDHWQSEELTELRRLGKIATDALNELREAKAAVGGPTKFSSYLAVPGGDPGTYREVVLSVPIDERTTPLTRGDYAHKYLIPKFGKDYLEKFDEWTPEQQEAYSKLPGNASAHDINTSRPRAAFTASHFPDVPNPVVHYRYDDRVVGGRKVRVVQEIQSDWHQKGRKEGYTDPVARKAIEEKLAKEEPLSDAEEQTRLALLRGSSVPDAPFKKTWHEMAFRKILHDAAADGMDEVAWSTAKQQTELYPAELRKVADRIDWQPWDTGIDPEGKSKTITITNKGEEVFRGEVKSDGYIMSSRLQREAIGKNLSDLIGKAMTEKILGERQGSIQGKDFVMGGKFYKLLYDEQLPAYANKLGKRWGAKVGELEVAKERFTVLQDKDGSWGYSDKAGAGEGGFASKEEAQKAANKDNQSEDSRVVHSLPITPEMRRSVTEEGLPLFRPSDRAARETAQAIGESVRTGRRLPPDFPKPFKLETNTSGSGVEGIQRVLDHAESRGMSPEASKVFRWLMEKNPALAENLDLTIRRGKSGEQHIGGTYDNVNRLITVIENHADIGTIDHEVAHAMEPFLPENIRMAIVEKWRNALADELKNATGDRRAAIKKLMDAPDRRAIAESFSKGEIPKDIYQYTDPSEYFAENFPKFVKDAMKLENGTLGEKIKAWLKGLYQAVKQHLGLDSDHPFLKAVDAVLKGKAEATDRMLHEGVAERYGLEPAMSPRAPGESKEQWEARVADEDKKTILGAVLGAVRSKVSLSGEQKVGRGMIRSMLARWNRELGKADFAFKRFQKYFDKAGQESSQKLIDEWERKGKVSDPTAQKFFETMNSMMGDEAKKINELNPAALVNTIENYFPHLFKDPRKAQAFLSAALARRPLEGNKGFLRQRHYDLMREALATGLEPAYPNPVDAALVRYSQMVKYRTALEFKAELQDKGFVRVIKAGEKPDPGFAIVDDPAFKTQRKFITKDVETGEEKPGVAHYYHTIPEPIARDLMTTQSEGLYKNKAWQGLRYLQNQMLTWRLGLSAFHAGFTTFDNAISHLDVAQRSLLRGDVVGFAKHMLGALTSPATPWTTGSEGFKSFFGLDGRNNDPHLTAILDALTGGGSRGMMHPTDYSDDLAKFRRDINQGLSKTAKEHPVATAAHAMGSVANLSSRLITHWLVPRQKMAARVMLAKFELEGFAKQLGKSKTDYAGIIDAMNPDVLRQVMGKVTQQVDDRLGQMAYDNLFWSRTVRDLSQAVIQAPGWNIGTLNVILGGLKDVARVFHPEMMVGPLDKAGKIPAQALSRVTGRLSYLVAMNVAIGTMGAITQIALTGRAPDQLKDYFFPRTGRKNQDGTDERISFPGYMKEEYNLFTHPAKTAGHKVHPSLVTLYELYQNKDFYGVHNRDSWSDFADYMLSQFEPYSIQGAARMHNAGGGLKRELPAFVGIMPAPSIVTRTPFDEFMAERRNAAEAVGGRTKEQAGHSKAVSKVSSAVRKGEMGTAEDLIAAGSFAKKDIDRIKRNARIPPQAVAFKYLPLQEKIRAWQIATPEQREKFYLTPLLFSKRLREEVANISDPGLRKTVYDQLIAIHKDATK